MVRSDYRANPTFRGCTIGCGNEAETETLVFLIDIRMQMSDRFLGRDLRFFIHAARSSRGRPGKRTMI